jgi:hypothetical protein
MDLVREEKEGGRGRDQIGRNVGSPVGAAVRKRRITLVRLGQGEGIERSLESLTLPR